MGIPEHFSKKQTKNKETRVATPVFGFALFLFPRFKSLVVLKAPMFRI